MKFCFFALLIFGLSGFVAYRHNHNTHSPILHMQDSLSNTSADSLFLEDLMKKYPQYFDHILQQRDSLRVQIIYTQINRDADNNPSFKNYYFNVDPNKYFYPASTVKMPIALLALQKLNELRLPG